MAPPVVNISDKKGTDKVLSKRYLLTKHASIFLMKLLVCLTGGGGGGEGVNDFQTIVVKMLCPGLNPMATNFFIVSFKRDSKTIYGSLLQNSYICLIS